MTAEMSLSFAGPDRESARRIRAAVETERVRGRPPVWLDESWALIEHGAEALADDLGPDHAAGVAADEVRCWIAILGADRT